jgi:uncharacterized protein (DUF885 family)
MDSMRKTFRTGAIASLALLTFAACNGPKPANVSDAQIANNSAELTKFLDAEYEKLLQENPETLTLQGRKDHYSELDDRSEAAVDRDLALRRQSVAAMKARFKPNALSEDARLSYDMWALELTRGEERNKWRRNAYVFSRGADTTDLPNFMINFHRVSEKSDMEAYLARVSLFDEALDQDLVVAKANAAYGVHMPTFRYDEAIDEIHRVLDGAPFTNGKDSALFADGKAKIHGLESAGKITADEAKAFETQLATTMREQMKPAYDRVAAFLVQDKPSGQKPEKQGALALPNGAAYYKSTLYLQTTTDMTADQIHELGLKEVARIRKEMEEIKNKVGFKGTLEEFFVFMRTDKRFYLPNTDEGRAEYLDLARGYLDGMKKKLPEYFGILPKADLVVKRVEAFREIPGAAQHYMAGTADGSRPGTFYAHLSDMGAEATYQLEVIAYHEGLPGHHLQISIRQELTGIPQFRTHGGYGAYSEGWGLYAESLAKEMGFYQDPYNDFGRLSTEIWRAIRLVVDTGIHAKGWTQKQAEEYFLANSPQPAQAVKSEIERYILGPGQATTYKIGMIAIQRLRDEAKAQLGAKFDYRRFHDAVLDGGALPIPVLEAKVHRWIEREGHS